MAANSPRLFDGGYKSPEPLTVLSLGLGQDSTAILYMLYYDSGVRRRYAPGRLIALTADTGSEHTQFYQHATYVEEFCQKRELEFELITSDMGYHTETWSSLEHFYASGDRIGAKTYPKSCTTNLKVLPLYKRLEDILAADYGVANGRKRGLYSYTSLTGEKIRVLIGISAEEAGRRIDPDDNVPQWMKANVERLYPLADMGMDRADCQDYIASVGHPVPYPSLCKFCPFKTELDVLYMARFEPEDWQRWVELEANKLAAHTARFPDLPASKNHGVFGEGTDLRSVLQRAREKYRHYTDADLVEHRFSHGHCVGSRY